ncbi:hypothetical protein BT96DRAFT_1002205 [Gymnopus androsaceus JB14]|uniref:Uncharacterized protein n=1 Tax=Gymnopus androsaceus JB14 TaxID=1447944 RepID=A0A6A4GZI3_9AGAR|nr:hypothetical protein BT96DRAFT_1002205 [Gymnopus androsaceus JB14]
MESTFTITVHPSTDIWRKPHKTNSFNAPTHALLSKPIPLKSLHGARLTFIAPWTTRCDHGGLLLHLTRSGSTDRWLKTGIEFYQGNTYLSTVSTLTYSDWSITPPASKNPRTTIEVRREADELGSSLWVCELVLGKDGDVLSRQPLREVTWFFAEEEGWEVAVSAMAARPAKEEDVEGQKNLTVNFDGVVVNVNA